MENLIQRSLVIIGEKLLCPAVNINCNGSAVSLFKNFRCKVGQSLGFKTGKRTITVKIACIVIWTPEVGKAAVHVDASVKAQRITAVQI